MQYATDLRITVFCHSPRISRHTTIKNQYLCLWRKKWSNLHMLVQKLSAAVGTDTSYLIHVDRLHRISTCKDNSMILIFRLPFTKFWIPRQFYGIDFLHVHEKGNTSQNLQNVSLKLQNFVINHLQMKRWLKSHPGIK